MRLDSRIWVPHAIGEVFGFFSDAANLEALTPPWLNFHILTPPPITMRAGLRIDYRIRIHGIPIRWQSTITVWDPPHVFVDEQVRGPYRQWVHRHTFVAERGGTTIGDEVDFEVPFQLIAGRLVRRDVERIFAYRREMLMARFP